MQTSPLCNHHELVQMYRSGSRLLGDWGHALLEPTSFHCKPALLWSKCCEQLLLWPYFGHQTCLLGYVCPWSVDALDSGLMGVLHSCSCWSPTRSSWSLCNAVPQWTWPRPAALWLPTSLCLPSFLGPVSSSMPGLSAASQWIKSFLCSLPFSHLYWTPLSTHWETGEIGNA